MAPPRTLATRLTPAALRAVRSGHPWIFRDSIRSQPDGDAGDLAVVFDDRRRFVAIGLNDPHSPIGIRVLHHGEPRVVDEVFFADRIGDATRRRQPLIDEPGTTAFRLVYGESDGLGGLVVDVYQGTAVMKLYSAAWEPYLGTLVEAMRADIGLDSVVLRASRHVQKLWRSRGSPRADGEILWGTIPPEQVEFSENGHLFGAAVRSGNKTGYFLDQRENRARVQALSAGRRVLDAFCSAGGFAVHAAAGGATSVEVVDVSAGAVAAVLHNFSRNDLRPPDRTHVSDAFDTLTDLAARHRRFDLVVIDPPSFAAKARDVPAAASAYRRLTELGAELLDRDGILVQASCSSRIDPDRFEEIVRGGLERSGRQFALEITGHPLDHPVGFPEARYLKAVFATAVD